MAQHSDPAAFPTRVLGHTAERVSAIGLGGWHLALPTVDEQLSLRIVRSPIDGGITFMDNSWDYNDGASELRMGRALRDGYRDRVFLMTEIDGRPQKAGVVTAEECLTYSLSLPTSVVITGCDNMDVPAEALELGRRSRPLDEQQVAALRGKTRDAAARGEYELFKTSSIFDSTASHPDWLGEEPAHVQQMMSA